MATLTEPAADEQPEAPPRRRPLLVADGPLGRRLALPAALALAAASGGLAVLAFPPFGLWPAAAAAVAGLAAAVHRRRARAGFGLGALHGAVFFLILLSWTSTQVGQWPWIFLSLLQAAFVGLLGAALAASTRLIDRHRALWAPVIGLAWVGQEALRARQPFGGFPWGRLAFSQAEAPAGQAAWLGGAALVTFLTALAGGLLLAALWTPRRRRTGLLLTLAAAVTLLPLALPIGATAPAGPTVNVAVVQGNVPRLGLDFNEQRRAVLDNHVNATLDLARAVAAGDADRPDVVVWPENASDIDPLANDDAYRAISEAAAAIDAPILLGGIVRVDGDPYNMSIVWDPERGPVHTYAKQHPVPFAEYVPFKDFFSTVAGWIDQRMADGIDSVAEFQPGTEPGAIPVGDTVISGIICFEIAYDGLVAETVREGAQILAVQTNNATFNDAEARQQLAMVQLRSIEHGRDGLMASTVGVSAFTDHTGALAQATDFNTAAVIQKELILSNTSTPAQNLGILPEAVLCAAGLAALIAATAVNVRHRRTDDEKARP